MHSCSGRLVPCSRASRSRIPKIVSDTSSTGITEFVEHYHLERNHQGLDNRLIAGTPAAGRTPELLRACGVISGSAEMWNSTVSAKTKTVRYVCTGSGVTCQMSALYSRIARSEEKRPQRATLRIDISAHFSRSR
jgi:hypothetical protein